MWRPSETALDDDHCTDAQVGAQGAPCHDDAGMKACPGVAIPRPNAIRLASGSTRCQRPRSHCFARSEAWRRIARCCGSGTRRILSLQARCKCGSWGSISRRMPGEGADPSSSGWEQPPQVRALSGVRTRSGGTCQAQVADQRVQCFARRARRSKTKPS
jgi:hypothetical protein